VVGPKREKAGSPLQHRGDQMHAALISQRERLLQQMGLGMVRIRAQLGATAHGTLQHPIMAKVAQDENPIS